MDAELKTKLDKLHFSEMANVADYLTQKMARECNRLSTFYTGIDHQVFGMLSTKEQSGFTELGMKQVNNLKELVDNFQ